MTSVTARHVSFSRLVLGIALSATTLQPGGRSQVMTSLEHYVTITRAISLTVPFDLPIISVPCIEITKRAPRSVSRVPRARARDADEEEHEEGTAKRSGESSGPPIESTCSPAIAAISIATCQRNASRSGSRDSVSNSPREIGRAHV